MAFGLKAGMVRDIKETIEVAGTAGALSYFEASRGKLIGDAKGEILGVDAVLLGSLSLLGFALFDDMRGGRILGRFHEDIGNIANGGLAYYAVHKGRDMGSKAKTAGVGALNAAQYRQRAALPMGAPGAYWSPQAIASMYRGGYR